MEKRYADEQIIGFLKQAAAGTPVPNLCREHGIEQRRRHPATVVHPVFDAVFGVGVATQRSSKTTDIARYLLNPETTQRMAQTMPMSTPITR